MLYKICNYYGGIVKVFPNYAKLHIAKEIFRNFRRKRKLMLDKLKYSIKKKDICYSNVFKTKIVDSINEYHRCNNDKNILIDASTTTVVDILRTLNKPKNVKNKVIKTELPSMIKLNENKVIKKSSKKQIRNRIVEPQNISEATSYNNKKLNIKNIEFPSIDIKASISKIDFNFLKSPKPYCLDTDRPKYRVKLIYLDR